MSTLDDNLGEISERQRAAARRLRIVYAGLSAAVLAVMSVLVIYWERRFVTIGDDVKGLSVSLATGQTQLTALNGQLSNLGEVAARNETAQRDIEAKLKSTDLYLRQQIDNTLLPRLAQQRADLTKSVADAEALATDVSSNFERFRETFLRDQRRTNELEGLVRTDLPALHKRAETTDDRIAELIKDVETFGQRMERLRSEINQLAAKTDAVENTVSALRAEMTRELNAVAARDKSTAMQLQRLSAEVQALREQLKSITAKPPPPG
jgi:chromosome segregation ATPase